MAENTAIEWADHTFNQWWGCQKVSPACDHCYAERDAKRFAPGRVLWGVGSERRTFDERHWQAPLRWAKNDPTRLGRRPRVFCASMADWLDLDAPISEFVRLLDLIRLTPELDWLLLSKRIGNWRKRLEAARDATLNTAFIECWLRGMPPPNVWLGATVVNQAEADRDIPKLLAVPARVRFLSIEPMLGPINLTRIELHKGPIELLPEAPAEWRGVREVAVVMNGLKGSKQLGMAPLSWVICGGESGLGARPMHPDWARSLRDQCAAAGVPFLFKQWGEWAHVGASGAASSGEVHLWGDGCCSWRTGKKAAGRQLDGRTHDGFPQV